MHDAVNYMFIIITVCDMFVYMTTAINFTKTKDNCIPIMYIVSVFYINAIAPNRKTQFWTYMMYLNKWNPLVTSLAMTISKRVYNHVYTSQLLQYQNTIRPLNILK